MKRTYRIARLKNPGERSAPVPGIEAIRRYRVRDGRKGVMSSESDGSGERDRPMAASRTSRNAPRQGMPGY